jgi:hypothetical protein
VRSTAAPKVTDPASVARMTNDTHTKEMKEEAAVTTFREEFANPTPVTMKIVSQTSVAGIDLYANWVLEVLTQKFKLSVRGQRNINAALNNLPVFKSADEKLSFGWVFDHALKNLGVHIELYERLALEVALSETFPERYAAKVLWEMAKLDATDQDVTPHFREMVKLVHSSNGLFTSTDFALLVEQYLRMLPDSGSGVTADQGIPAPEAMALVLSMLAQVTKEDNKQMTIVSGRILAWFAAAAEWLFDLGAAIYLASGERVHGNHDGQKTQVLLIFSPAPKLEAKIVAWTDDAAQALAAAAGSMSLSEKQILPDIPFGGRVVWNSLLSQAFGQSFQHLERKETRTFGTALGAAARAIEDSKARYGSLSIHSNNLSRPVGAALVKLLTDWLPELRRLQGRIERQLTLTPEESRKTYVESIEELQKACGCGLCGPVWNLETYGQVPPPYKYCLTVLVETIVVLGMVLSRVTVAPQIFPTAQGVRNLYRRQFAKRIEALETKRGDQLAISDMVYGDEWDSSDLRRLQNCAELFSGSRPVTDLPENLVALAHEGICVYLAGLERTSGRSRDEDQDLIRVTSGGVGVRFKIFTRAALGPVADAHQLDNVWEEVPCSHLLQSLYCK